MARAKRAPAKSVTVTLRSGSVVSGPEAAIRKLTARHGEQAKRPARRPVSTGTEK